MNYIMLYFEQVLEICRQCIEFYGSEGLDLRYSNYDRTGHTEK